MQMYICTCFSICLYINVVICQSWLFPFEKASIRERQHVLILAAQIESGNERAKLRKTCLVCALISI